MPSAIAPPLPSPEPYERWEIECTCGLSIGYPGDLRQEAMEQIAGMHARRHGCRVTLRGQGLRVTQAAIAGKD